MPDTTTSVDHTTQIEEKENKKWNTTQQIKDGQDGLHQHIGVNPGTRLGYAVSYHFVTIIYILKTKLC
jgi:mannose-6-phosphate isomerase-like protein (cupin superfamily)